jgi:hypothetical protein
MAAVTPLAPRRARREYEHWLDEVTEKVWREYEHWLDERACVLDASRTPRLQVVR